MDKTRIDDKALKEVSELLAKAEGEMILEKYRGSMHSPEELKAKADEIKRIAEGRKRKAKPKLWRTILKKAAIVILALGVSLGAVCALSEEARAMVANWYREIVGDHIIYHFQGEDNGQAISVPTFGWLPEGFEQRDTYVFEDMYDTWFEDENGDSISFSCDRIGSLDISEIVTPEDNLEKIIVNDFECDYYQTLDEDEASFLIWQDDKNNVVCELGATLDKETIVKIAENIIFDN